VGQFGLDTDASLGSLAAGWQATMGGYVAAGSAFAILQSLGMLGALAIPMSGLGLFGASLAVPKIIEWFLPLLRRWWDGSFLAKLWEFVGKNGGGDHA
jgi:hypothetical protein